MTSTLQARVIEQGHLLVRLLTAIGEETGVTIDSTSPTADIVEHLFRGLEHLHEATAVVAPVEVAIATEQWRMNYPVLVERVRARLAETVPPDEVVAVITRGDGALLGTQPTNAWHFPRDHVGAWAGYHPANGSDALAHLRDLCAQGVRYLAIPATSRWWLDFYNELREHLESAAEIIVSDEHLSLYRVADADETSATPPAELLVYRAHVERLTEFVSLLVPPDEIVYVVSRGDDAWLTIHRVDARHFPSAADGRYLGHPADDVDAVRRLEQAIDRGARYLAVPAQHRWWKSVYPGLFRWLNDRHRCVAEQIEIGSIYLLSPAEAGES